MARRAGFMVLPGEIRNEVYELVVLNMQKESDLLKLVHLEQKRFPPQTNGYRGLTQICQQVRREFLPFWQRRHLYVEIDLHDSARFVDTFYDFKDARALADANGSIEVSLDRESSSRHSFGHVDLLPFLRLMVLARRLQFRFVAIKYIQKNGPPDYISDLVAISRLVKVDRDELRHHFLCTLTQLMLSPLPSPTLSTSRSHPPSLQLHLSPEISCYDLTMRKRILYETGFVSLSAIELRVILGTRDYCEDLRRVNHPNSDGSQFGQYKRSGKDLPPPKKCGPLGEFRVVDKEQEGKDNGRPRQVVVWERISIDRLKNDGQQECNVQEAVDAKKKTDEEEKKNIQQSSSLRSRLRASLPSWSLRTKKKKKNQPVVS